MNSKKNNDDKINFVIGFDGVLCTPIDNYMKFDECKPLTNAIEFVNWVHSLGHHITIWTHHDNDQGWFFGIKGWLLKNKVTYDRLLFSRPNNPVFINDTPSNIYANSMSVDGAYITYYFAKWKESLKKSVVN